VPRIHIDHPLQPGTALALPPGAARHVQVLRLQPGDAVTLFNGAGGEWSARITQMGRNNVDVDVGSHHATEREAPRSVHLVLGMPANERMDWLVEKAAELGVASIQPLLTERTVLRLAGERAEKKRVHWQAVAVAACEQCGRNRVPQVYAPITLNDWSKTLGNEPASALRLLLSLRDSAQPLQAAAAAGGPVLFLSGPEGGLSPAEEDAALAQGFVPVTLGSRVLRAETAPLAALAALTLA
jgi:16S rRNA (uracil1498-N3)-methyltransferase